MAEQFRTQTWLHPEGDGYRFKHDIFTHVLAAEYIRENLAPENVSQVDDWNPASRDASTVITYTQELLSPPQLLSAASCLTQGALTAYGRTLILSILKDIDKSSRTREKPDWLADSGVRPTLGLAVKAAMAEPDVAGAVVSCVYPHVARSQQALEVALCFLAVGKRLKEGGGTKLFAPLLTVIAELAKIREQHGHGRSFEDLLDELRETPRTDDRLLKAAGFSARDIVNPFLYEPVFSDLDQRLRENTPDPGTWRYIRHAAQYLRDYVQSKSGHR